MNLFKRSAAGLFASETLLRHLLRGLIASALLVGAVRIQEYPLLALLAVAGALIALRGCPICWTIGLVETMADVRHIHREHKENGGGR